MRGGTSDNKICLDKHIYAFSSVDIHVNRILVLTSMDAYIAKNTENNLHVNDNFVISINKRFNYNFPFPRHFFPQT